MSRRIAIVLPDPPLPFGNAASRWFAALVHGLVQRGHHLTTLAVYRTDEERERTLAEFADDGHDLRLFAEPTARSLAERIRTWRQPYAYPFSHEMRREIDAVVRGGVDVLHLEQLWTGWIGWHHQRRALLHVHYLPSIDLTARHGGGLMDVRLRTAERRLLRRFGNLTALTPRLAATCHATNPDAHVDTVPFALDLSRYPFPDREPKVQAPTVTLIGSFDWDPTLRAARRLRHDVWPRLRAKLPGARLAFVGRKARHMLGDGRDEVTVTENVPDILPYFHEADLLIYPVTGASGAKVKVIEALALGTPVVTTPEGVEGLDAEDGRHVAIETTDDAMVERAVKLLTDAPAWHSLRRGGRDLVASRCDPAASIDRLEAEYDRIARTVS